MVMHVLGPHPPDVRHHSSNEHHGGQPANYVHAPTSARPCKKAYQFRLAKNTSNVKVWAWTELPCLAGSYHYFSHGRGTSLRNDLKYTLTSRFL